MSPLFPRSNCWVNGSILSSNTPLALSTVLSLLALLSPLAVSAQLMVLHTLVNNVREDLRLKMKLLTYQGALIVTSGFGLSKAQLTETNILDSIYRDNLSDEIIMRFYDCLFHRPVVFVFMLTICCYTTMLLSNSRWLNIAQIFVWGYSTFSLCKTSKQVYS